MKQYFNSIDALSNYAQHYPAMGFTVENKPCNCHCKNGVRLAFEVTDKQDSEVIETAEQVGLPLIVIPKNNKAEYSNAIEQIMDKLLYGDNFKNSLINNTIYHLLNFEKHKTFQGALRQSFYHLALQLLFAGCLIICY